MFDSRRRKSALARNLQPYEARNLHIHKCDVVNNILLRPTAAYTYQNAGTKVKYSGPDQEYRAPKAKG